MPHNIPQPPSSVHCGWLGAALARLQNALGLAQNRCLHCLRPFSQRLCRTPAITPAPESLLCPQCRALLAPYAGPRCPRCDSACDPYSSLIDSVAYAQVTIRRERCGGHHGLYSEVLVPPCCGSNLTGICILRSAAGKFSLELNGFVRPPDAVIASGAAASRPSTPPRVQPGP